MSYACAPDENVGTDAASADVYFGKEPVASDSMQSMSDASGRRGSPRSDTLTSCLSFTPPERLIDAQRRPYFLWDCDLTLDQFRKGLADPDPDVRAYLVGKLMRQAKPDDVFLFVRPREIRELWPRLTRYLGRTREFWSWLFETWEGQGPAAEPFGPLAPPDRAVIEGATIQVDNRHEMLASKLATLLERSEIRDLVDVKALLDEGGDLQAALSDAPKKDAGFSSLALAWVLKDYDPRPAARALDWSASRTEELQSFKRWLIDRLTAGAAPEEPA